MGAALGAVFGLIYLAIIIISFVSFWKIFVKAGGPGWAILVPIYNIIVMLKIAGKPLWCLFLIFIPLVGIVFAIMVGIEFAKKFGKGVGFGLGLAFLGFIFGPILAFGDAKYEG